MIEGKRYWQVYQKRQPKEKERERGKESTCESLFHRGFCHSSAKWIFHIKFERNDPLFTSGRTRTRRRWVWREEIEDGETKGTRKSVETPITSVDREESIDTSTLLREVTSPPLFPILSLSFSFFRSIGSRLSPFLFPRLFSILSPREWMLDERLSTLFRGQWVEIHHWTLLLFEWRSPRKRGSFLQTKWRGNIELFSVVLQSNREMEHLRGGVIEILHSAVDSSCSNFDGMLLERNRKSLSGCFVFDVQEIQGNVGLI